MLRLQDVKTGMHALSIVPHGFHLIQLLPIGLAEAALGEGSGAKLHKLSVKDIQYVSWVFAMIYFLEIESFSSSLALRYEQG